MKKTKLYAKKTLSVFMAAVMLMTAWVFVAPTEASAATSISYPVTLTFNLSNCAKGGHILIYYYPVNADGTLDTSNTNLTYTFMNSLVQYSSGDNQTFTAGASGDNRPSGDSGKSTGNIPGWPYKVYIKTNGSWGTNANIAIKSIKIGNKTVLSSSSQWSCSNKERNFESGGTYDGIATTWPQPAISSVRTAPTAQTISVPKGSSASKTFTAYFNDQYGMQWPSSNGLTVALSPALTGASVSHSGNTATVTGNNNVFNNSDYNSSNGQIKTTLQMTQGGVTASCDVTFQAPKYNVYLQNFAGNIVKTYSNHGYYNQSVTLTDLPANTATAQISGDEAYHQPYKWPDNIANAFNLDGDKTYTEEKAPVENHSWSDWTQNADNHSRTCSVCGYVQSQAHVKDSGTITTQETCTQDGVKTYNCAVCGKTAIATETVNNITGHAFTGDIVMKADGKDGTHYRKCVRFDDCGTYGFEGVVDNSQAHNWDKNGDGTVDATDATSSKASTCEEAGFETYTCKVCPATWTKTLDLAAHKTNKTAAKDATNICGGDGNEAFWTCSVCYRVWKDEALTDELADTTDADSDGIPDALETKGPDHSFTGAYVSASGGKDGTHYRQCARFTQCKTYGPEEKHTWGDPAVTEATCEKTGKRVYTCTSGCGQTYEETIDKVAHSMTKHDAVEAKCGVAGSIEYYSCSICGKNYSDANGTTVVTNTVVPALEHKWTAHHDYDELKTPATCQDAAVYHNHCDYCKTQLVGAEHSYGEKDTVNGHKFNGAIVKNADGTHSYKCTVEGCTEYGNPTTCRYEVTKDVASTCKTAGYTTYKCKDCGHGYSKTKDLDPNNHTGEGTTVKNALDAKCNTDGYTGDTHCLGCNTKIKTGSAIIADKTVHPHEDMKKYDAKASTCQTEGWKEYKYCSACGTYEVAKVTVPVKAHSFKTYTSNNNGTHTATCETCDAAVAEKATDTKDCTGGTANCVDKAVCTVCNTAYGNVNADNHKTVVTKKMVPATCQTEGTEAYRYCEACKKALEEIVKIEKAPHDYGAWSKVEGEDKHTRSCTTCDATVAEVATETGDCSGGVANCIEKAKCAICKAEYGAIDPTKHKSEANTLKDVVPATCQKEGFSGNYRYNCCDKIKQAGTATEKLAHKFDIEVENSRVAATCIAKGEVTYKCSTCVESEGVTAATNKVELPIDSNNHASGETVTVKDKAATCETDGYSGDVYHKCCYDSTKTDAENRKALISKGTVIKANGQHVYGTAVPEYMIAEILEEKDEEGNVIRKTIRLKDAEPDYAAKVAARREDNKWYHAQQCTICGEIVYGACYTYAHTYSCVNTDTCEVCKGLCSLKNPEIHSNLVKIEAVEATHTTDGTKEYYKCADCGKFFLDDAGKKSFDPNSDEGKKLIAVSKDTVPCTSWEEEPFETVEPTCGVDGYKKYACTVEGCTKFKVEVIPATADSHEWSTEYKEIKAPTCGEVGYKAIYCSKCDAMKPNSASTIPATGEHTYEIKQTVKGTSCADPTIEYYECSVCGKTKTETVYDSVSEHKWSEWTAIGGDCSTGVVMVRTCSECKIQEQKIENTNKHENIVKVRVEPTCEKEGYIIYVCKNCGMESDKVIIPIGDDVNKGHTANEDYYKIVKEATCTTAEQREYTCLHCGETFTKYYGNPLDHTYLYQPEEIATCERAGHSEYYRCVRCLDENGGGLTKEIYPALGHVDGDNDGKCDECNSKLYDAGANNCSCMCHKEGWLMKFIYKIVNFFWKLFKINHSCACGATHY